MKSILGFLLFLLSFHCSIAQLSSTYIDSLSLATMKEFEVPGMAIGIIKDGKIVHNKGYGLQSLSRKDNVDEHTLFGIASNSKAFTCMALGMLVDEGKLQWDDRVRKYIPEFTLSNPYITDNFTVKDLVTHRSGLGLGAGDLMFFPEGGNNTITDILNGMKHLPTKNSFRNEYQYNNNFFIIAGEVIRRISGKSWEQFIDERILKPVGMKETFPSYNLAKGSTNIIDAHAPTFNNITANGIVTQIPHDWSALANPAGGIMSNIHDMLIWAKFLLNDGVNEQGKRLISSAQLKEMWSIHTPIPISANNPYNTHFNGYGLGWVLSDVKGYQQVTHTGGLIGTVTQFILIPDLELGIVVLTNQQSGAAFMAMSNTIKDSYLGYNDRKWLNFYAERMDKFHLSNDSIRTAIYKDVKTAQAGKIALPKNSQIIGIYHDKWFGDITISEVGNELRISCDRSPRLKGKLLPYHYTTYVAQWDDRSYDADAFVMFSFDEKGKANGFKMKPIAPITDFSFDFEDLEVKRK